MADDTGRQSVTTSAAQNLANTTKTIPQMVGITPRWLVKLLPWVSVEAGTYRVNRRRIGMEADRPIEFEVVDGTPVVTPDSLRSMALLRKVETRLLKRMAALFEVHEYASGDTVLTEGEPGEHFFIIAKGKVEVSTTGPHGERLRLALLDDGHYFGEMALINDEPRSATISAASECIIVSLARKDFASILDEDPRLRKNFERVVSERKKALESVNEFGETMSDVASDYQGEAHLPETLVDYEEDPREYPLSIIQTVLRIHTRVTDLYNQPFNQLRQQLRLTIEAMKERQEYELINNPDFGLVHAASPSMRIPTRGGPPTPDDMDELLAKVWKQPAFFLAHPRAIAAFGRECTRRGVPPPTLQLYGSPFLTWRGVPLIPCNKLAVRSNGPDDFGRTNILLMRVGESEQGVVGLHQPGLPGEQMPSLSVRFMGINPYAVASYLVTFYFSAAVLTDDALGMLENVEVGRYHDYA